MKTSFLFLIAILIGAVILPIVCLGQIDLEQVYPSWSKNAPNLQSIVKNNSLGEVINFFVTWAIIISVLLAALSLVYGGVMYLFSAGQVNKTTNAKKRIRESFYGLLILAGSFLVLQFINPQVTILQIKKTTISSGTVLFSEQAFKISATRAIEGFAENKTLEQLSEEGKLVYLNGSFPDLTKSDRFGDLVADDWDPSNNTPTSANFRKFSVYALGFWGEKSAGVEVHLFLDKNYAGKETIFTEQGRVENEVVKDTPILLTEGSGISVQVIPLTSLAFGQSPINLEDGGSLTKPNIPVITYDNNNKISINHPPLSASLKGKGIGVNLFADLATSYGMRYLNEDFADFRLFDFDDKAIQLELITKDPKGKEPDKNLIVLVSSGYNFHDEGKVMFTTRERGVNPLDGIIPTLYFNKKFYDDDGFDMKTGVNGIFKGAQYNFFAGDIAASGRALAEDPSGTPDLNKIYAKFATQPIQIIGNVKPYDPSNTTPETGSIETANHQYGSMVGASSLQLFELSDNLNVCKSVKICNSPSKQGHCLVFTNEPITQKEDMLNLPMPWYIPVNLPDKITASFPTHAGSLDYSVKFNDNIKSIEIDGKCLVVLYKHRIIYSGDNSAVFSQWDGGQNYTEAFTQTVNDLTSSAGGGYQMGRCAQHFADSLTLGDISTCASSIVVFPIK